MTNEQKEKALAFLKDMQECTYDGVEEIRTAIESLEQQPSDETIKYLECNDIDIQEFSKVMKRQPLQAVNPNSTQLIFEQMNRPNSEDCVSRADLIDKLEILDKRYGSDFYWEVRKIVDILPSVTPTRKSGLRWIERFNNEDKWLECPHCHKDSDNAYAYCPNCGASFKEEKRGSSNGSK